MTDLEILGIIEDNSMRPSELPQMTSTQELEWECSRLNRIWKSPKVSKYLKNNINTNCVYSIVEYDPQNTSNMGCGYTKFIFITAHSNNDIEQYCLEKFGEVKSVELQWGSVHLPNYHIKHVTPIYFVNELDKLIKHWHDWNNCKDIISEGYCWKTYNYSGAPYHVANGIIVPTQCIETIYKPSEFIQIEL